MYSNLGLTHVFPPAARIAESRITRLRDIGLTTARAESIRAFARAYSDERLQLDAGATLAELTESLEVVPGVGPWTAQMIAMQAACHPDAFPAGDLGLRRNVGRLVADGRTMTHRELDEIAEAWRPHRSLAAMHLWLA